MCYQGKNAVEDFYYLDFAMVWQKCALHTTIKNM